MALNRTINVSWTVFKFLKDNMGLTIYELSVAEQDGYFLWMVSPNNPLQTVILSAGDISDYETNYQSGASSAESLDHAIALNDQLGNLNSDVNLFDGSGNSLTSTGGALDVNVSGITNTGGGGHPNVPADYPSIIANYASYTTTGATEETAFTYNVTASTTFNLMSLKIMRGSDASRKASVKVKIAGTTVYSAFIDPGSAKEATLFDLVPGLPLPFGDDGDAITVTVDEVGGTGGNTYDVTLIGFES